MLVKIYTNTKKALQAFITEKDATKEAEPDNYNDDNDETKVESYAARRLRMATTACSSIATSMSLLTARMNKLELVHMS